MRRSRILSVTLAVSAALALPVSNANAGEEDQMNRATSYEDPAGYRVNGHFPCDNAHDWKFPTWPIRFMNDINCNRQVWLWENLNKTGYHTCISPGNTKSIPERLQYPSVVAVGLIAMCP